MSITITYDEYLKVVSSLSTELGTDPFFIRSEYGCEIIFETDPLGLVHILFKEQKDQILFTLKHL